MAARIYQRMKNAMQSGRHRVGLWTLEFEPDEGQRADPLTGWAGSADTRRQLRLTFPSQEAAEAYAKKEAIAYHVVAGPERVLKIQAYADNFK
jgi:hypothetical protein